jgi:hypothetical protein
MRTKAIMAESDRTEMLDYLTKENSELHETVAGLQEENARLLKQNAELEEWKRRRHTDVESEGIEDASDESAFEDSGCRQSGDLSFLPSISERFQSKSDYISEFSKQCSEHEWWFEGELMRFFKDSHMPYATEVQYPNQKNAYCDVVFENRGVKNWMELKVVCTTYRRQKPKADNLSVIPAEKRVLSHRRIDSDVERLGRLPVEGPKWSLIFVYPSSKYTSDLIQVVVQKAGSTIMTVEHDDVSDDSTTLSLTSSG